MSPTHSPSKASCMLFFGARAACCVVPDHPYFLVLLCCCCREYRVLLGHARLADVFVDTSRIGTDALFERCTHFAPLDTTSLGSWHRPQML
jgi:hypothetical protein